jgi:hypothetical protein
LSIRSGREGDESFPKVRRLLVGLELFRVGAKIVLLRCPLGQEQAIGGAKRNQNVALALKVFRVRSLVRPWNNDLVNRLAIFRAVDFKALAYPRDGRLESDVVEGCGLLRREDAFLILKSCFPSIVQTVVILGQPPDFVAVSEFRASHGEEPASPVGTVALWPLVAVSRSAKLSETVGLRAITPYTGKGGSSQTRAR